MYELLALILCWIAVAFGFGFWHFVVLFVISVILFRVFGSFGTLVAEIAAFISGVGAVNQLWHEPIYNVGAVIIIVLLVVSDRK
jgi:hypothetical protein